jgi:hypothetical protein
MTVTRGTRSELRSYRQPIPHNEDKTPRRVLADLGRCCSTAGPALGWRRHPRYRTRMHRPSESGIRGLADAPRASSRGHAARSCQRSACISYALKITVNPRHPSTRAIRHRGPTCSIVDDQRRPSTPRLDRRVIDSSSTGGASRRSQALGRLAWLTSPTSSPAFGHVVRPLVPLSLQVSSAGEPAPVRYPHSPVGDMTFTYWARSRCATSGGPAAKLTAALNMSRSIAVGRSLCWRRCSSQEGTRNVSMKRPGTAASR